MRKSREWWKAHYDNYLLSKLSIAKYSNKSNINKSTFYGWIKKFREGNVRENTIEETNSSEVQWASIEPIIEDVNKISKEYSALKIIIGKAIIEITSDFNPKLLDAVTKVLIKNA
ncbi:MAG: hypothetical protein GX339_09200 [Tissierellia bacterium]|nr:hypothetical protein [Tissierellia bacterium]